MKSQAVITPEEYEFVKCRIEKLVNAAPGSEEAKELTRLIREFEAEQLHQLLVKLWC